MKVVAVIPCYNEEKTIAEVVRKTKEHTDRVIVVDNMSSDKTLEEAEKELPCYNIYRCYSKGAGITTGYGLAYSLNPLLHLFGDIIVTLDGDGQHDPDEIPQLIQPILDNKADVVIGSRFMKGAIAPTYRKFGIDVITWLYNVGHRQKIKDGQCCFRAFNRETLKSILPIEEHGFSFSVETLIKARAIGSRIYEVPVSCIYHEDFKDNSTMNPIIHGLGVVFGVIKWRFKMELVNRIKQKGV